MQEIKFRAWNKATKTMGSALPLRVWTDDIATDIGREKYLKDRDNIVLMQYTGLKDKNGKEIYEGDIIGGVWEVRWWEDKAEFVFCNPVGEQNINICAKEEFTKWSLADSEIIGNIHKNPELLQGGKEGSE